MVASVLRPAFLPSVRGQFLESRFEGSDTEYSGTSQENQSKLHCSSNNQWLTDRKK